MRLKQGNSIDIQEHEEFAQYLLRIGEGRENVMEQLGDYFISLPKEICLSLIIL